MCLAHDPNVLYTSSQHCGDHQHGQTWKAIIPIFTRGDPKRWAIPAARSPRNQNGPEISGTISPRSVAKEAHTIWTGSDDGLVYVTRDAGETLGQHHAERFARIHRISLIDARRLNRTAYLAGKRYQLDDRKPYIYRIDGLRKKWTKIVDGIPQRFVHAVREDLSAPACSRAAPSTAFMFVQRWRTLAGLSAKPARHAVSDLLVQDDDLQSRRGRSFYVLTTSPCCVNSSRKSR